MPLPARKYPSTVLRLCRTKVFFKINSNIMQILFKIKKNLIRRRLLQVQDQNKLRLQIYPIQTNTLNP